MNWALWVMPPRSERSRTSTHCTRRAIRRARQADVVSSRGLPASRVLQEAFATGACVPLLRRGRIRVRSRSLVTIRVRGARFAARTKADGEYCDSGARLRRTSVNGWRSWTVRMTRCTSSPSHVVWSRRVHDETFLWSSDHRCRCVTSSGGRRRARHPRIQIERERIDGVVSTALACRGSRALVCRISRCCTTCRARRRLGDAGGTCALVVATITGRISRSLPAHFGDEVASNNSSAHHVARPGRDRKPFVTRPASDDAVQLRAALDGAWSRRTG